MDLPRRKSAIKNKTASLYPQGILDIMQMYYPGRCNVLPEGPELSLPTERLLSKEEWLDILTKSRHSHEQWSKFKQQRIRRVK